MSILVISAVGKLNDYLAPNSAGDPTREERSKQSEMAKKRADEIHQEIEKIKIGSVDSHGYKVRKIYCATWEYIIYEVESDSISDSVKCVYNTDAIGSGNQTYEECWREISHHMNDVKAVLYKARRDASSYKYLLASAIGIGISGKAEEANRQLIHLEERIEEEYRKDFRTRTVYLIGNLTFLLIVALADLIAYKVFGVAPSLTLSFSNTLMLISFASIGGALSVAYSVATRSLERDLGLGWFFLYGFARGLVALLCGSVIYFAIKGKMAFEFFSVIEESARLSTYILAMILAGFSETLVPSILNKLERDEAEKTSATAR